MQFNLQPSTITFPSDMFQKMFWHSREPLPNTPAPVREAGCCCALIANLPLQICLNLPCWVRFLSAAHASTSEQQLCSSGGSQAAFSPFPSHPHCFLRPSPHARRQQGRHLQGPGHLVWGLGLGAGPDPRCLRTLTSGHTHLPACCRRVPQPAGDASRQGSSSPSPLMGSAAAVTADTRCLRERAGSAQIQP